MKKLLLTISLLFSIFVLCGQKNDVTPPSEGYLLPAVIIDGDTMPCITTSGVMVLGFRPRTTKKEQARYTKLVRNIIKVYPYARLSAQKLKEYDEMLALIPNVEDQQKAMKAVEKQLRKDFMGDIEYMTFQQGILLLKLVDRETGKTTYKIVNELRGKVRAFFYQAIAKMFKYDLKAQYDPIGSDKEIEKIVVLIEEGNINYTPIKR